MGSPVKIYLDENVAEAVLDGLRMRGLVAESAKEAGLLAASDHEHLEYAVRNGCVILTQDRDFLRLHAAGTAHSGIIYARQGIPIGIIVKNVTLLCSVFTAEEMENELWYLPL